jgi:glycerol-3-phosphate acyltransferase PlsY
MDVAAINLSFQEWIGLVASYALGCFATGYYWVRWKKGLDIRQLGSGNVGAKNASRILGKNGFLVTFLGDCIKGALAVAMAKGLDFSIIAVIGCMLMVVVGHNWPVQLRFHGGKGISTSFGAMLIFDPLLVCFATVFFLLAYSLSRSFTLCGLAAFVISPIISWLIHHDGIQFLGILTLAIMVLVSHHQNIIAEFRRSKPVTKVEGNETY